MEGIKNVLSKHAYMFDERLEAVLNRTVSEKKYWLLTIDASRKCFEMNNQLEPHENDACSIEKRFATVPD